jgi:peptidoglycan hydrolase-like protein with peptidoglycan-binding domain
VATVRVTVTMDVIDLRDADERLVRGRHVDNLQGLLTAAARSANNPDFDPRGIDGLGGRNTKNAVERFQDEQDVEDDDRGIVGRETWEKLIPFPFS